ncbi:MULTISPECIES: hypothetical protein [unclassified Campylobacter]|nr:MULTISPECIES: hypothetical protein [unclassified Campylobacter]MDA3043503.1 hypothetical protein [Campylobacter sp. JMF_09 ED2]MDA3045257.1 hypothetical protein [Campylobacter sp. JMF_07 ED4]MDA3064143.1 hypothetical protein [Campylobacter sp. JMF_11 EL3]MDA3071985.1 hypothetical protein [Campylobacter sp. VBCF_03 NA9]MDA3075331.1 hypothetical protein [Campylobacter sp. JMF_05 ED3]
MQISFCYPAMLIVAKEQSRYGDLQAKIYKQILKIEFNQILEFG